MWDGSKLLFTTSSTAGAVLTQEHFERFVEHLKENNSQSTWCFEVSPRTMQRLRYLERLGRLYHAHPAPRRKIRKCYMRKLQVRWKAGKAHIARVERAEIAREEVRMQQILNKENQ